MFQGSEEGGHCGKSQVPSLRRKIDVQEQPQGISRRTPQSNNINTTKRPQPTVQTQECYCRVARFYETSSLRKGDLETDPRPHLTLSHLPKMADTLQDLADIPKDFFKDGTAFLNRCTKRMSMLPPFLPRSSQRIPFPSRSP